MRLGVLELLYAGVMCGFDWGLEGSGTRGG